MNFLFTGFLISFLVAMSFERIWEVFFKINKEPGKIINKWTLSVLAIIHIVIIIATLVEYFLVKRSINLTVSIIGFILYILALIVRNWSINTLGRYHSPYVEIRGKHLLIRKGPYKYLRHPYYLSVLFEFIGFPLVANSYYALCISLFVYIPTLFILRVYPEEKAMINEFGEEYLLYKKEVRGFLPLKKNW